MMAARRDHRTSGETEHLDTVARLLATAILRHRLRVYSAKKRSEKELELLPQQSVHVVEPASRDGER